MNRSVIRIAIYIVVLALAGCTHTPKPPPITEAERQLHVDSFEEVWTTIRDQHWDSDLCGPDWQAIHDELLPEVQQATTDRAAVAVMEEMISRLGQSHFGIISESLYEKLGAAESPEVENGSVGISTCVIEGKVLVTEVEENSHAAQEGVLTGWQIVQVGENDLREIVAEVTKEYEGQTKQILMVNQSAARRLRGKIGATLDIIFINGRDERVVKQVNIDPLRGNLSRFGNMPEVNVWAETAMLPPGIQYIRFNYFFDPVRVMELFNKTVSSNLDAKGFIIDLRGNPGGIGIMATTMAGWFVSDKGLNLGTMYMRNSKLNFVINPRANTFNGHLAVLIDGMSASTSEILAGGLKDLGRARIFGSLSAGAALPSMIIRLPDGNGFQYAFANYISSGGDELEGNGVMPHDEVKHSRPSLLAGHDDVIDAAVNWINSRH